MPGFMPVLTIDRVCIPTVVPTFQTIAIPTPFFPIVIPFIMPTIMSVSIATARMHSIPLHGEAPAADEPIDVTPTRTRSSRSKKLPAQTAETVTIDNEEAASMHGEENAQTKEATA
jgi:hypothetical protein